MTSLTITKTFCEPSFESPTLYNKFMNKNLNYHPKVSKIQASSYWAFLLFHTGNGIKVNRVTEQADGPSLATFITSQDRMWIRTSNELESPIDTFKRNLSSPLKSSCKRTPPSYNSYIPLQSLLFIALDTLASWPDPEDLYRTGSNKAFFKLNTNLQIFDKDGDLVHPLNYDKILLPRTWILFDANIRL